MNKQKIGTIMCLMFGFIFICVGMKCTPQWLDLSGLSRTYYLIFGGIFLIMGCICLRTPILWMLRGLDASSTKGVKENE